MKRMLKGFFLCLMVLLAGCQNAVPQPGTDPGTQDIPAYFGSPYVEVNEGIPAFSDVDLSTTAYKEFEGLDKFGRPVQAYAVLGPELLPDDDRQDISMIYPPGWDQKSYDFIEGGKLYNRCHLLAWSLTGENANPQNLITGTRYMNTEGMLPFEMEVLDYIRQTGNHVLYRVTPEYTDDNLLADGVQMEAWSVEDDGRGIKFNVYCYNVQPGVVIDYADGANHAADQTEEEEQYYTEVLDFILNTRSMKFHTMDCPRAADISAQNRDYFRGTRQELLDMGYTPAQECN